MIFFPLEFIFYIFVGNRSHQVIARSYTGQNIAATLHSMVYAQTGSPWCGQSFFWVPSLAGAARIITSLHGCEHSVPLLHTPLVHELIQGKKSSSAVTMEMAFGIKLNGESVN